jgi:hypothetical protein
MKQYKYVGLFRADNGHEYELSCYCMGFLQAFFLLTAEAIKSGKHYQLATSTSEHGDVRTIDNISKCLEILS